MEFEHSNVVQQQEVEAQQDLTESVSSDTNKRKEIDARSKAWEHFERIKDEKGVTIKGLCIYCGKKLNAHTKFHGTSSLRNHILICKKCHIVKTLSSLCLLYYLMWWKLLVLRLLEY